jgi:hypothetical protein
VDDGAGFRHTSVPRGVILPTLRRFGLTEELGDLGLDLGLQVRVRTVA